MEKDRLLEKIDMESLPKHIGIIMDGNGRWAEKKGLPRSFGHKEGSERVVEIVEVAYNLGIKSLSLFAFSTENWKRPKQEIMKLMELLSFYLKNYINKLIKNNIRLNVLGSIEPIPLKIQKEIENGLLETKDNDKMVLNIGLNYGGQDEIIYATKKIVNSVLEGKFNVEEINKELFESYLFTKGQPPLDLLIRPSGELRVSNFMLYQLAYAEFWFSDVLWPDFKEDTLLQAIYEFQNRDRRFGGL